MRIDPSLLGAFYACSEIILSITRRSRSADRSCDRHSLIVLWSAICIGLTASIFAAQRFRFAVLPYQLLSVVGLILFVVGIAIRWYSIIHLGRFFTVDVSIAAGQRVISSGPYRLVRHPSYSGALLAFVGFGLCLHNWIALLVLVGPVTAAFLWRIRVEERVLNKGLGEQYRQYAGQTKRLIPLVW